MGDTTVRVCRKFIASSGLDDQAQVAKELIKGADTDRDLNILSLYNGQISPKTW